MFFYLKLSLSKLQVAINRITLGLKTSKKKSLKFEILTKIFTFISQRLLRLIRKKVNFISFHY